MTRAVKRPWQFAVMVVLFLIRPTIGDAQSSIDKEQLWRNAVKGWQSIRHDLDQMEFTCQEYQDDGSKGWAMHVALKDGCRKLELLSGEKVQFAVVRNLRYGFMLDSNDSSSDLFVADATNVDTETSSEINWQNQFDANMPPYRAAVLLPGYNFEYDLASVKIRDTTATENGCIRIGGEYLTTTRRLTCNFDLLVDPNSRYAIQEWTFRFPEYTTVGKVVYSDALGGVFPTAVSIVDKDLKGNIVSQPRWTFGTPNRCRLSDDEFEFEHYGIETPSYLPLEQTPPSKWKIASIAVVALLIGVWAWQKYVNG